MRLKSNFFHFLPLIKVYIDYAHTPDALEQVLLALRQHASQNLWLVFGCGGDRDPGKRAEMGAIASKYADRILVTSDNPRTEDASAIIQDILSGIDPDSVSEAVKERQVAIALAIGSCAAQDVILVAGKGHEDYQIIGTKKYPFNDYLVAQSALQQRCNSLRAGR